MTPGQGEIGSALVTPAQGEIWWAQALDKRRPVLVVTRSEVIPLLRWIVVAPVSRTVRGIPTEVPLGPAEGLPYDCAASFDNLQPVRKTVLTSRIGAVAARRTLICEALAALVDC